MSLRASEEISSNVISRFEMVDGRMKGCLDPARGHVSRDTEVHFDSDLLSLRMTNVQLDVALTRKVRKNG